MIKVVMDEVIFIIPIGVTSNGISLEHKRAALVKSDHLPYLGL